MSIYANSFNESSVFNSIETRHIQNKNRQSSFVKQPIHTKNLNLDKLTVPSQTDETPSTGKLDISVKKTNPHHRGPVYSDYFSVDKLKGLNGQQKKELKDSIQKAVNNQDYISAWTPDKKSMFITQSKAELDLIANQLVPSQYQSMLKANESFYKDQVSQMNQDLLKFDKAFYRIEARTGLTNMAKSTKEIIQDIKNGDSSIQNEQTLYKNLYAKMNKLGPDNFAKKFEAVMLGYKQNQKEEYGRYWGGGIEHRTNHNIEELKEQWNAFIDSLPSDFNQYRIPTVAQPIINTKI